MTTQLWCKFLRIDLYVLKWVLIKLNQFRTVKFMEQKMTFFHVKNVMMIILKQQTKNVSKVIQRIVRFYQILQTVMYVSINIFCFKESVFKFPFRIVMKFFFKMNNNIAFNVKMVI